MGDVRETIMAAIKDLGDGDKLEFDLGQWGIVIEKTDEPVSRTVLRIERTATFHNQTTAGKHRFFSNGVYEQVDDDGDVVEDV